MTTKYILKIYFLLIISIFFSESGVAQSKDFDIRFTASGPFPINFDEYIDNFPNANISIRNKTNKTYEFEMYSFIVGPYNISGESKVPHCTQDINPGATRNFPRGTFNDLCINYRIADFNFDGIPSDPDNPDKDLKGKFLINHILPEGEYEICIQAKEVGNLDNVLGSVCFKFSIIHPSRPIITQPTENYFLDATVQNTLNISWIHSINNARLRASTTYNVKIIDKGLDPEYADDPNLLPPAYSAYELMEDPGVTPVLFIENVKSPYIATLTDLNLTHGHNYAIAVYAANTEQPLGFDLVRSDIVSFEHVSEFELECGKHLNITPISPSIIASNIPFTRVPLVIRLEPYCDKYRSLNYTTTLLDITTNQMVYNHSHKPRWDSGPRNYLNVYLHKPFNKVPGFDPDGYYSSHLALGELNSLPALVRGHQYKWTTQGAAEYEVRKDRPEKSIVTSMNPILFEVGMPKNIPASPINGAMLDTGLINFELRFNDIIQPPMPPFKIIQFDESHNIIDYTPRTVNEYGIIQVSKYKDFRENIMAKGHMIQLNESEYYNQDKDDRMLNSAGLMNALYADLNFEGRFTDTATYYWRFGWYKNPDILPADNNLIHLTANDFYNISAIDSFKIGDTTTINTAPLAQASADTVCGCSCTIPSPVNTSLIGSLAANDEILVGKFLAKLTEVTKTGSGFTGKAWIKIPFLNQVTMKVTFSNLQVNTDKIVFAGEMIADAGGTELESIANIVFDQPMQLPLGWDATVKGRHTILALTYMKFLSTRADMTASINFGDLLPEHMTLPSQAELSGTFCFHPGGFSETMVFHLSEDMPFDDDNSGYGFVLKGGAASDTTTMCYIKWACKGFAGFQLAGEVLLSESLLNKDSGLESNDAPISGRVKAGFKFKYIHDESAVASDNGFILQANMDAFQFKDFEGWGFDSDTMYLDWSDSENPPGFIVPQGYTYAGMKDPQLKNGWEGIYIPRLKTLTPKDFGKGINRRTAFSGSSMIFGEGKYHVSLKATNIFNDSWARMRAKMDTIQGVISSDEKMIRFKGGLLLPFTDTTSWIDYGGHYSGFDSIHLYVAIAGDSVHMEDLPIEFKFDNTSLLNIVRGADRTFRANAWFNGIMDLEMNAGHVHSSLSSLSYSGIKFENLGYKSGVGFDHGNFSFASPQKTMNGFPIQLDSIDFVSEGGYQGFYFKPKVVLVGDVNGFSAAAGLNLLFKFDFSGGHDFISDTKLELKDVELDVKVSGFELKGKLAFINRDNDKGMEGILAAKLPGGIAAHLKAKFGTKTTNENAAFNTASNYSYWYVDGMVTFGNSGIPMFAGMSLYGIGGGMWYHMTQNPITNKSYAGLVGAATDTANINYSGIGYSPSFSSHYGMKLQGLFGSENEGRTYNMLLAVWAQFNNSGGPNVGLDGDMRFMGESVSKLASGDAETTTKSVWGDVHFVYNSQEHFVQGNLNAFVNVKVDDHKLFYGKLPGNKMVEAEFFAAMAGHAESEKWYLKIGTPEAKAGAVFDLKIKKTEITAYLMVGHGLPNEVPDPDPGFLAMLNSTEGGYIGGSSSSATNKAITYSATGIAAGVLIKDTFAFNYQPFYLNVDAIIGADINITQDDKRKCLESENTPGVDGWYGSGQVYAGIQGVFGIYVDIWFIEGKFEFLRGSIALLMNGGLPNPSWFYAKGAFKYKVIGLIEGTHAMEISVGDKCTVGSNSPFGGMKVIQDLYPANDARDVSVYVTPKALVSPYVNQELEVFDIDLNRSRIFKVNWASNTLKQGHLTIPSNLNLTDGSEIYMPTKDVLDDHTWYSIQVKVTASELISDVWVPIANFSESDTNKFRTGVMPDDIGPALSQTYPIIGQNYFLKNEKSGAPGYVTLFKTSSRLLYTSKDTAGFTYNFHYEAQFFKLGASTPSFKSTIQVENFKFLKYNVSSLENNTTYICKIVRVLDPSAQVFNPSNLQVSQESLSNTGPANASVTNIRQEGFKTVGDIEYHINNAQDVRDRQGQSVSLGYKIIPQKFMRFSPTVTIPREHVLLEYRFKTSKYNTLAQKIGNKSWNAGKNTINRIDYINAGTSIAEQFDYIDLQGWSAKNESGVYVPCRPLVTFGANFQIGGENYGDNLFDYLPTDAIVNRNKGSETYQLPIDLSNFLDPPNAPTINAGLSPVWNLQTLQIGFHNADIPPYVPIKIFEPSLGKEPLPQSTPVQSGGTAVMTIDNPGFANQSALDAGPSNNFSIKLNHGKQMYRQMIKNRTIFSSTLDRTATSFEDIMAWIKSKSVPMERRLSYYILSDTHGHFECVSQTKMGIIYQFPRINYGHYDKTSSLTATVNITCPPPPQID